MKPAVWPRGNPLAEKLLWIDPEHDAFGDAVVGDLARMPRPGDLLVVNDAATLPGSLAGATADGLAVEVRLAGHTADHDTWVAIAFGQGDWRTKTQLRSPPPLLIPGTEICFQATLRATVVTVGGGSPGRAITLRFHETGEQLWRGLYALGRPIQYAYLRDRLPLFHVQTAYASRPWAAEMPSAGRPLGWGLLLDLRARGVGLARVTHAAGISSTGGAALDATLPWPERFDVPSATVEAIGVTRRSGGRVIAVGTSVVRALEGAACSNDNGELRAGDGTTNLVLGPGFVPRVVDGLYTGLHDPTASHFALLQVFASRRLLERAYMHAERAGYLGHEMGDSCLILRGAGGVPSRTSS